MLLIGEKILECRKAANLSQEEFAAKIGVTRQAVSQWELDKAYPDLDKLVDICEIFQISITKFIYGQADAVSEEADPAEVNSRLVREMRGRGASMRLYGMMVLLGGILLFCSVVFAITLFHFSWGRDADLTKRARVERVYQQYTKADLCIYDDAGRNVQKTVWLDVDGIRDGDFIRCYTNEEQDGIYYNYQIRTLVVLVGLVLLFLLLFLLCCGEIRRLEKENKWHILEDKKVVEKL